MIVNLFRPLRGEVRNRLRVVATVDGVPPPYPLGYAIIGRRSLSVVRAGYSLDGVIDPRLMAYPGEPVTVLVMDQDDGYTAQVADHLTLSVLSAVVEQVVDLNGGGGGSTLPGEGVTRLSGTVVDEVGRPVKARVRAVHYATGVAISESDSDPTTGAYEVNTSPVTDEVILYAVKEYGAPFSAVTALSVGAVVHPSTPNGYVYRVSAAGVTGPAPPVWTTNGESVLSGSVVFEPEAWQQPVIDGVFIPTVVG